MIAPSLACADWLNLEEDIVAMSKGGVELLHIDIMDGHFVPNLCLSFDIISAIRRKFDLILDVHLMVTNPFEYLDLVVQHKIEMISFHLGVTKQIDLLIDQLQQNNIKVGIALKPHESIDLLKPYLSKIDYVLFMCVNPGFAGQKLIRSVIDKIYEFDQYRHDNNLETFIEADGGIDWVYCLELQKAGVDIQVGGALNIFDGHDVTENCQKFSLLAKAKYDDKYLK